MMIDCMMVSFSVLLLEACCWCCVSPIRNARAMQSCQKLTHLRLFTIPLHGTRLF